MKCGLPLMVGTELAWCQMNRYHTLLVLGTCRRCQWSRVVPRWLVLDRRSLWLVQWRCDCLVLSLSGLVLRQREAAGRLRLGEYRCKAPRFTF